MSAASAVSVIPPFVALMSASLTDRSPVFAVAVRAPAPILEPSSVTESSASTEALSATVAVKPEALTLPVLAVIASEAASTDASSAVID